MSNNRRGPLAASEKEFIARNAMSMSADEIAKELNRNPNTVRKFIADENLVSPGAGKFNEEEIATIQELHGYEWWPSTFNYLNEKEIFVFESLWVKMYKQFDYDVLPSECLQIKKYITLEILKDRALTRIKDQECTVKSMQKEYDAQLGLDAMDRDLELIKTLREQISASRNTIPAYNKEFQDLCKEQSVVEKGLNGLREQRVKNIQDANKSWSNVLRMLEDLKTRKTIGKHIEIMKAARDKEMVRLTQLHKYVDGSYDHPILSGKLEAYYEE